MARSHLFPSLWTLCLLRCCYQPARTRCRQRARWPRGIDRAALRNYGWNQRDLERVYVTARSCDVLLRRPLQSGSRKLTASECQSNSFPFLLGIVSRLMRFRGGQSGGNLRRDRVPRCENPAPPKSRGACATPADLSSPCDMAYLEFCARIRNAVAISSPECFRS